MTSKLKAARQHLSDADPVLGSLIERVGPCRLRVKTRRSPYEALVSAVVYQQLNGSVAEKILGRVCGLFPGCRFPGPEQILEVCEERLRSAGLSRNKALALKDIAAKTVAGIVPARRETRVLSDQEIVQRLTEVRGVGPWTVEMLLIFTLGRPDVLPATDFGVQKGFALTYGRRELPRPKELLAFGERWRPYRSVASWYLWRAVELPS